MLGEMIARIRREKNMTKSELSRLTEINIGHLTHIEKGERNPSHKALKLICKAFNIPYQQLMYTYDKKLTEEQLAYKMPSHISYNCIPLLQSIDSISDFIECPAYRPGVSFAIRVTDDSMNQSFDKNSIAYIELNSPLINNDIGLFQYRNQIFLRRYMQTRGFIYLKADNDKYENIQITPDDNFYIIGKVIR